MRTPSVILGALAAIASLSGVALAQGASPRTTPNKPPASTGALNEDAMTDVYPDNYSPPLRSEKLSEIR